MDSIFLGGGGGGKGAMMTNLPFSRGSNSDPLLWGRLLLGCMDANVWIRQAVGPTLRTPGTARHRDNPDPHCEVRWSLLVCVCV